MGNKESKKDTAILDFQVTGKSGKIVISLESVKPKEYNTRITSAISTGPYGASLTNLEDN
jgi:hypothetical protein